MVPLQGNNGLITKVVTISKCLRFVGLTNGQCVGKYVFQVNIFGREQNEIYFVFVLHFFNQKEMMSFCGSISFCIGEIACNLCQSSIKSECRQTLIECSFNSVGNFLHSIIAPKSDKPSI